MPDVLVTGPIASLAISSPSVVPVLCLPTEGWPGGVELDCWLHHEMVYLYKDCHPSCWIQHYLDDRNKSITAKSDFHPDKAITKQCTTVVPRSFCPLKAHRRCLHCPRCRLLPAPFHRRRLPSLRLRPLAVHASLEQHRLNTASGEQSCCTTE